MLRILAFTSILLASCSGTALHPDNRILNATEANVTMISYQASIEFGHAHRCSGAIITPSWVLTVAHCIKDLDNADLRVRANAPMRGVMGDLRNVSTYITHPRFEAQTLDYDIALLQLSEDLPSGNATNTTITIAKEVPLDGNIARVSGWGSPSSGAWLSAQLTEKNVTIVYFNECQYAYSGIGNSVTERMMCASSASGGPCEGDPGNPLVFGEQLIGLVSWSFGCRATKFPTVYTDVTKFKDWIANNTGI